MTAERLCVVMPVYNEQDAIGPVLEKWVKALTALGIDFVIRPYNDGSKDRSLEVMRKVAARADRIEVRDKKNGGHGNTILTGYREAAKDGFDWVFQIDSDDEMGPEKFGELWTKRGEYDFLVGIRDGRKQALPRKIISFVSRLCVRLFYGKSIWDVNTPYRLMRVSKFREFYEKIPLTTFAPNVILSGLVGRNHLRFHEIRVPQHDRTTGEVSIKKWKLLKAAARSFYQTIAFAVKGWGFRDWLKVAGWCTLGAAAAVSIAAGARNGMRIIDFQWAPAKLFAMGLNPYPYSLGHINFTYPDFVSHTVDANQVPSCLMMLWPFTLFSQVVANQVWDGCNLVFTAVFLVYLKKMFFAEEDARVAECRAHVFWLVAGLLLASTSWRVLIGNGQHLMFSLAFFLPAVYYAKKGRGYLAGVLLALSAFKYTTIAPLALVFISMRWWRAIIVAAAIHIVATVGCGLWLGENPVTLVLQSLKVGSMLVCQGSADIPSMLAALGFGRHPQLALAGYAVFGALALFVAFSRRYSFLQRLALLALIADVMFYHREYDFVVLVFPLVWLLMEKRPEAGLFECLNDGMGEGPDKRVTAVAKLVLWTLVIMAFFGTRVLFAFGLDTAMIAACTVLHHLALAALLVVMPPRPGN